MAELAVAERDVGTLQTRPLSRVEWSVAFLLFTAAAAGFMIKAGRWFPDDAYIFFRYARNISGGDGWTYNAGDAGANGATSPLWTLILAAAFWLRGNMESNAWLIYALCLGSAGTFTFAGLRHVGQGVAGACAALFIVSNPVLILICGMEAALFVSISAALIHFGLASKSDVPAGVLGGLLVLVRPEGIILFGLIVIVLLYRSRKVPWKAGLAAALVLMPWVIYSTIAFGSPIAGTLAAKTAQGKSGYFGPSFVFMRYLRTMVNTPWTVIMILLAIVGLIAGLRWVGSRSYVVVVVAFGGLHFAIYGLVIQPPAYLWYYAVTYWVLAILAGVGAAFIARVVSVAAGSLVGVDASSSPIVSGVCAFAIAGAVVVMCTIPASRAYNYVGYERAAAWIRDNTPESSSVAATEIGLMGWRSERTIVDYLGLLSRQSAEEVGRADLSTWLAREQPDYFISHVPTWDMEQPSMSQAWFPSAYVPVFESAVGGWSQVRVFQRIRSRAEAAAVDETAMVTEELAGSLESEGIRLDGQAKEVLGRLLHLYLIDGDLQARFETSEGTDLSGLIRWAASSDDGRLEQWRDGLTALASSFSTAEVTTFLAPSA